MLNSSAIYGPPLRAFLQSRAFVPVTARERDWGWSACAPADRSIPSHSSCKFLLNQLAEIHLGCVALITQLCPKRHTDVFIHIKVIQCPGPGPQHQYYIYISQYNRTPACQVRMLSAQISGSHRLSCTGSCCQSYQDDNSNPNREVFQSRWNPGTWVDISHSLSRGQYNAII